MTVCVSILYICLSAAPTEVTNLDLIVLDSNTLHVTWDPPLQPNGVVSYTLNITYTDLATNMFYFVASTNHEVNDIAKNITFRDGLEPYAEYIATVVAMTTGGISPAVVVSVLTEQGG